MRRTSYKAQNLIEFVIVIPLLVVVIFGVLEYGMFWKNALQVQAVALQMAGNAATQVVTDAQVASPLTFDPSSAPANFNAGVAKAIDVLDNRYSTLGITSNLTYRRNNLGAAFGTAPYMLYEYESVQTQANGEPLVSFTIDYRDPYNQGVIVQLVYNYRTILMGAQFSVPGGNTITIIPRDIPISSTKIQQYEHY